MTARSHLLGLLSIVAVGAALTGCPNPNVYTTPRTIPQGTIQHTVAIEAFGAGGRGGSAVIPALPTYSLRYGLGEHFDIGGRIVALTGLGLDLKWNFVRTPGIDLAVDPGVQLYSFGFTSSSDSGGSGGSASSFFGYFNVPLIVGFNLGPTVTLLATPGFMWGFGGLSGSDYSASFGTGAIGRLGVGANLRLTPTFALHPELTFLKPFDTDGVIYSFGLGFQFGSQARY